MSSDRAEIVRQMADTLSRGDARTVAPHLHPDFEWVPHVAGFTVKRPYRGARGLRDWHRLVRAMFRGYAMELEDVNVHEGHVVAIARQRGRARGSRVAMEETLAIDCEFRDGRLRHARAYPSWGSPELAHGDGGAALDRSL